MTAKRSKKAKRVAEAVVDTGAFAIGSAIRLTLKAILTVLFIILVTGLLFTCVFAYYVKTSLSSEMDIKLEDMALAESSTIWYTDSNGDYQELATLKSTKYCILVEYEDVPQYMIDAVVAIEDKRFYEHKGVDWYRTAGAVTNMFLAMSDNFGGSTLTQQLIKNVTQEKDVTVQRKLLEIFRALEFEKTYTKEEIVQGYLNFAFFGAGGSGVGAAAEAFFGKEVWELSLAECASIVAVTNNPSIYSPYVSKAKNVERRNLILYEMYDQGYIGFDEYQQAKSEELVTQRGVDEEYEEVIYSWYVEALIDDAIEDIMEKKDVSEKIATLLLYNGGLQIYACIDMGIQAIVDDVYGVDDGDMSKLPTSWSGNSQQFQSACVILDPSDGDIVALVGGTGQKTVRFGLNRATEARRQPGSSFKPIASYGPAFELGLITQTTIVNDSPGIKLDGISNWYPKNSGGYSGPITIRTALIQSKNTVAAQIIDKIKVSESYKFLKERLGIELAPEDEAYAPLALGGLTIGVTVREMAQAFGSFANDGVFTYSRTYSHINNSDGTLFMDNTSERINAFSPNTAYNIADMLKAAVSGGTGTDAFFNSTAVAGKTGTTESNKDRYFAGFTAYYACAVWTGYDQPAVMNFSGNPAAKIFKAVMAPIHQGLEYKNFPAPTIGSPTNIFGNMKVEPSESPSEEPSESPSEDISPTPTEDTPTPSGGTPTPSGGTPTPSGGTPTPSGGTPTPSGGTPTPSGGTPTPTGGTPTPTASTPVTTPPVTETPTPTTPVTATAPPPTDQIVTEPPAAP